MKKIDKALEIVRAMSNEELKEYIKHRCPRIVDSTLLGDDPDTCLSPGKSCEDCWNEEVKG